MVSRANLILLPSLDLESCHISLNQEQPLLSFELLVGVDALVQALGRLTTFYVTGVAAILN